MTFSCAFAFTDAGPRSESCSTHIVGGTAGWVADLSVWLRARRDNSKLSAALNVRSGWLTERQSLRSVLAIPDGPTVDAEMCLWPWPPIELARRPGGRGNGGRAGGSRRALPSASAITVAVVCPSSKESSLWAALVYACVKALDCLNIL